MKLTEAEINLNEVMIDPYNPRFPDGNVGKSQEDIINLALNDKSAKELLNSLNTAVRWVNKIVVLKVEDYKHQYKYLSDYKYVVVEGNTRVSCLKSGGVEGFDSDTTIPMLIAEKEEGETDESYYDSILITQGIANVMVVKEWDQIAKAKHIYNLYVSKSANGVDLNTAVTQISSELGIKKVECKKHIQRYSIYSKVDKADRRLTKAEWGYLEAFDVNPRTRAFTGLNENMSWNEDFADEVIPLIGDLIDKATREVGHTKKFRDYMKKLVEETEERDDIITKIESFIDDESEENLINAIKETKPEEDESEWQSKIKSAVRTMEDLPANKIWSESLLPDLEKLHKNVHSGIIMIKAKSETSA